MLLYMDATDSNTHFSPSPNAVSQASREAAHPPSSPYIFEHLSDAELLLGTRGCVARSNQELAALLAHLAEVEARGIYKQRACASLCIFCIYELRMSEDSAFRHARAARIARQFPVLFGMIAAGEIHLTGVVLIAPHLTEENHRELLQRVKYRSKREITKIVRVIDPLPDVPPRIEPLGPALSARQTSGTWQAFLDSRLPVRELPPGQRPGDWLELGAEGVGRTAGSSPPEASESQPEASESQPEASESQPEASERCEPANAAPRLPAQRYKIPQRYKIQFQASQEYVDLLEKATDLLPYAARTRALEEVHLRAMRLSVAELEKRKYGLTKHPRAQGPSPKPKGTEAEATEFEATEFEATEAEATEVEATEAEATEAEAGADTGANEPTGFNTGSTPVARVSQLSATEVPRRCGSDAGQFAKKDSGARGGSGSDGDEDERSAIV
jgi:hypothetical protein